MQFEGLIAATFTPFNERGGVDTTGIKAMVDRLAADMISGIYICGSTGEGHSLTIDERKTLAEHFIKAADGRLRTIVNVGHNCLEDACELARHAQAAGADAISAAPPTYYKISSPLQLVKVLSKITEAAPDIPFFYYHIPAITKVEINMEAFLKLASGMMPSLAGIKFTAPAIHEFQRCREEFQGKYQILFGMDEMMLGALSVGADCFIGSTYNFMPGIYHQVMENQRNGNMEAASKYQYNAVKVIDAFLKYSSIPAQRSIMKMIGIDCGPARLPLIDLDVREEEELRTALQELGFFEWTRSEKRVASVKES